MTIELHSRSEDETRAVARRLAAVLEAGDVVALDGPLGSGKTCFVRGLAEGMGLDPSDVSSPTFIISQEYTRQADDNAGVALIHVDAYRLTGPDDLESIGLEDVRRGGVLAIEWAARLEGALGEATVHVEFTHEGETERGLAIAGPERIVVALDPVPCKVCRAAVEPTATTAPFCSPRCRDADLYRWFDGSYRISRTAFEGEE